MIIRRLLTAIVCIGLFMFSCKNDTSKIQTSPLAQINDSVVIQKQHNVPKCDSVEFDHLFYANLEKSLKIENTEFYDIRSLKRFSNERISSFFDVEKIECFLSVKSSNYQIIDIRYMNDYGKSVFDTMIQVHRDKRNFDSNDLEAFFKRGIIISISEDDSQLTMIFFNPFIKPKLVKVLKEYFHNNNSVKESFMSTGLGATEQL